MKQCLSYSSDMLPMSVDLTQYEDVDDIIYTLGSGKGLTRFGSSAVCDRTSTSVEKDRLKRLNEYLYLVIMLSNPQFRNNGWELTKIPYRLLLDLSVEIKRLKSPIALVNHIRDKKKKTDELTKIGKAIEDIGKHCISILIAVTLQRQVEALAELNKIFTNILTQHVLKQIITEINNLMSKVKPSVMPQPLPPLADRTRKKKYAASRPGTVIQTSAIAMVVKNAKRKITHAASAVSRAMGFAPDPAAEVIGDDAVPMQGTANGRTANSRTASGRTASGRTASGRTASGRTASGRTASGQRTTKRRRASA
jgi:hypothetical protein